MEKILIQVGVINFSTLPNRRAGTKSGPHSPKRLTARAKHFGDSKRNWTISACRKPADLTWIKPVVLNACVAQKNERPGERARAHVNVPPVRSTRGPLGCSPGATPRFVG
jgi:hypothetical protein